MIKSLLFKSIASIVGLSLLLLFFQNCNNNTKFGEVTEELSLSSLSPESCDPSTARSCRMDNGVGAEFCDVSGQSLGCNIIDCNPGFLPAGNSCVPQACSPNSQAQCLAPNGSGVMICDSSGTQYGACEANSCNPGYVLQNKQCVSLVCAVPSNQVCNIPNGAGSQVCVAGNGGRNAWGTCMAQSCSSGYILQNNSCVPGVCMPGNMTACSEGVGSGNKTCTPQAIWGACVINACSGNYRLENGVCVANLCLPGALENCMAGNGSGTYTCNAQGTGYGACNLSSCNPGFNLQTNLDGTKICVANACAPASQTGCSEGNGSGMKTCNPQGSGYGSCVISSCNAGFNLQNGVCVANACSPGSPAACTDANGSGSKICNAQGTGYGSCVLSACNTGFNFEIFAPNNRCVAQACSPNTLQACSQDNGSGVRTCNPQGTGYGSCVLNACNTADYTLIGGVCVLNVCTPNSITTCSENNGTGNKTCNAQGTAYGSCVLSACNTGFYGQGVAPALSCIAQICSPNAPASCPVANGNGTHTCNALGSAYGECSLVACNAGFNAQNGACVANVCSPNTPSSCPIVNGNGTHTCNALGSGYGACSLVTCNAGFNAQNGACVANICSPNTSSSCPKQNGTGSHTCNAQGSGFGICSLVSCNAGFNAQNGACVANICSPNTASSCPKANGVGSHTCNAQGSGYGACSLVSCNAGYNAQNGACVLNVCSPGTSTAAGCTQPANGSSQKTCNATGSAYGACSSSCDAGYNASGAQPNISCYGVWQRGPAPACSVGCGLPASVESGAVTCSTASCNPATEPQPFTNSCAATAACPAISWILKGSTCSGATTTDTLLKSNKTGYGGSIGSANSNEDYKLCANFQSTWGTAPPDNTWIDAGLRDDSDGTHSLSENTHDGVQQTWWIKSPAIGTSRWHRTGTGACPAGWLSLKIWDTSSGKRDICKDGSETQTDNLCLYPMPAACDSVMLCTGSTFKVLNYQIPATSAITTAQMDAYCDSHARGGINDYNFFGSTGDHAGGPAASGNSQGAYYGSCFSKSAKSTGSRTTGPSSSSAFTCTCD